MSQMQKFMTSQIFVIFRLEFIGKYLFCPPKKVRFPTPNSLHIHGAVFPAGGFGLFGGGMKQIRASLGLLGIGLLAGCNLLTAAPVVSIENPGTITGTTVTVTVNASGASGIQAVGASLNGVSLGEDREAPYTFTATVNRARNGINTLSGYATNTAGGFTYAQPVTFTVNIAPSIALVSSSASITNATPAILTATPTDTSASFTKVEFYQGSTLVGTDSSAPFEQSVSFTQASQNGVYSYTAKSFDAQGNSAVSGAVPITVNIPDSTIPTVSLSASASANGVMLSATASDDVAVTKVEFYNGTTLLATDTSAPFAHTATLAQVAGTFPSYSAKAFDAAGNNATSIERIEDVWENASGTRNNARANAVLLDAMSVRAQSGATLGASLDSTAFGASDVDTDFYAVNLTFAQILKVRTFRATGVDTVVRIYDATGNQLAFNDDSGDNGLDSTTDSAVNWRAVDSGTYYISVAAYTDGLTPAAQGAGKQYRINIQVGD
jgi:hypothetical protein